MSLTVAAPRKLLRTRFALVLLSAAFVGAIAAASLLRRTPIDKPSTAAAAVPSASSLPRVEVLRVTLRPTGFDPAVLAVPRGRVLLAVDDRSGLDEVTLRFDREAGGRLREVRAGRDNSKWRDVFNLQPGEYVLGVAGRLGWICRITVTAD